MERGGPIPGNRSQRDQVMKSEPESEIAVAVFS